MSLQFPEKISLHDLNKQFPFSIDDDLKKQLCFAETLIISCGHNDGTLGDQAGSDSDWTCTDSNSEEEEIVDKKEEQGPIEIKKYVPEPTPEEVSEVDDDFTFYFFPDCNAERKESRASITIVDGIPKLNPAAKALKLCTCGRDTKGKCKCFTRLPCFCGKKLKSECKCSELKEICICPDGHPTVKCVCRKADVCTCYPGLPHTECIKCKELKKICLCIPGKAPFAVCPCPHKPKYFFDQFMIEDKEEVNYEGETSHGSNAPCKCEEELPCDCQKPDPKEPCHCLKGNDCFCETVCVCDIRKTCICEPTESKESIPCKSEESKSICSCDVVKECTCDAADSGDCTCFPKKRVCECGDATNCKCMMPCTCGNTCICDTDQKEEPCKCASVDLIPNEKAAKKIKRSRAGKHGYRWCHDVDPRHTYFDYAYDKHDKIDWKLQEKEKFKVLGLYEEVKVPEETGPGIAMKAPEYKKEVKRATLDCCSSVGGISISVETLGEERSKFLVQVVSHSSKGGAKTGSKIVSIVDCKLHTMEENRTENMTKKDITKERRSYIAICSSGYYNKISRICGERNVIKRLYHTFEDAHDFLLEGANVILLRYFAIQRVKGVFKTDTVMMDGNICQSIYHCAGVGNAVVNGKPFFVAKVERHIIEPNGVIHQSLTVLTLKGYMVSHEWANSDYIIHINPLLHVNAQKDEIEQHCPIREKWREDLQLFSDFLDFKSNRLSEGARYMAENGALSATVRDYLQAILLLRPQDTVHFTRHYFGSALSALDLPHNEYFDPCPKHVRYFFFDE